jgi:hypothetical protein
MDFFLAYVGESVCSPLEYTGFNDLASNSCLRADGNLGIGHPILWTLIASCQSCLPLQICSKTSARFDRLMFSRSLKFDRPAFPSCKTNCQAKVVKVQTIYLSNNDT